MQEAKLAEETSSEFPAGDDRTDIEASLAGDEAAYARLVQRYQDPVTAQMWRFTRDRIELGELVQDVFVEAYTSLQTFRGKSPYLHWLRRIATRVGYRHWRAQERTKQRQEALAEWSREARQTLDDPSPSEAAEYLHHLLARLPPQDRLILTLQYFEECDTREIASRMGWSRTLVKVRAFRARRKLKTLLAEAGFGRENNA